MEVYEVNKFSFIVSHFNDSSFGISRFSSSFLFLFIYSFDSDYWLMHTIHMHLIRYIKSWRSSTCSCGHRKQGYLDGTRGIHTCDNCNLSKTYLPVFKSSLKVTTYFVFVYICVWESDIMICFHLQLNDFKSKTESMKMMGQKRDGSEYLDRAQIFIGNYAQGLSLS